MLMINKKNYKYENNNSGTNMNAQQNRTNKKQPSISYFKQKQL